MAHRRILVTGGCGYLGSQVVNTLGTQLSGTDATIRIMDNLQSGDVSALHMLPTDVGYEFVEGDILDPSALALALDGVETVVHLAAVVGTPLSFENPAWLKQVNHWGTAQLAEACLTAGIRRIVFSSSTAVYGPGGPFAEPDRCNPQGAYAESKLAAELALDATRQRGLDVTILRLGSIFGLAPVTRYQSFANRLAHMAGVRRVLTVYGDGRQRRPLIHVRDAAHVVSQAVTAPDMLGCNLVNVVAGTYAVGEVVECLCSLVPGVHVRHVDQDIRTRYSFAVANDLLSRSDWTATMSLHAGLAEIVNRYTGFQSSFVPPDDEY